MAQTPDANCNTAALQTLLMTAAEVKNDPVVPVTGYFQSKNDGALSLHDSHMWLADSEGKTIDPMPTALAGPPAADGSGAGQEVLDGAALLLGGLVGTVLFGESRRRRRAWRQARARAFLKPLDSGRQKELYRHISLLEALLYAPPDRQPDAEKLERRAEKLSQRPLAEPYRGLPPVAAATVKRRLRHWQRSGNFRLSGRERRRFLRFVAHLRVATASYRAS